MISAFLLRLAKVSWLLPGFLLWASFPPMGEKTDVVFALAPLLWISRRKDVRSSVRLWFWNGLLFWVATLSWMPAIVKNGGPWPLVVLGWFCLAAYCAAYFAAFGYLSAKMWGWAKRGSYVRRLAGVLLFEPILWCGLELIRSRLLGGFSWNQLGVVAVNGGFGAPAALGGVYLCSAVILLVNGTLAGIAERTWRPEESGFPGLRRLGILETALAFAAIWGLYQIARPSESAEMAETGRPAVKVALVQRNFPCVFKRQVEDPKLVYARLLENVSALRPDLVVLAESAMCEFGPVDQQGAVRFAEWVSAQCGGAAVLAGGTRFGDGKEFNSAALYSFRTTSDFQTAHALSLYDKVHLVPFGEFIPGDKLIPALQKLAPVGSCTPGELKILSLPTAEPVPLGVAICFEDTDSAQMRELARQGARILFFITNDSWFSQSNETVQHAWQAVARAIETGLPVIRVGNSGVSGTIAPTGQATWLIDADGRPLVDRDGTMFDRVLAAPVGHPTPYVRFGDFPLGVAFLLLIGGMILVKYKTHYEKRRNLSL